MDRRQREMLDVVELEMHRFLRIKRKNDRKNVNCIIDVNFKMEHIILRQLKLAIDNACTFGYMNLESCYMSLEKITLKFSDKHTNEEFVLEVA